MILRSQSKPQPLRSKPISIRQIMKDHDDMIRNDQRILPPGLTDPSPEHLPLQPQAIARQALKMGMPIYPPSHIQSQTSVQLSDFHDSNAQNVSSPPRRIRIFDINSYQGRNYRSPNASAYPIKNAFSFGDQINVQPSNDIVRNDNQSSSNNNSVDPATNQNRSNSEIFQTVRSMRKTTDPKNNTIYEQLPSRKEQSGISLRSNQNSGGAPGIRDSSSFSNPLILKQTTSQYAPPILQPKRSTQYQSIKPQSKMNEKKAENSSFSNPINSLSRSASPKPPVPVYENEFYKLNRSGDSFENKNPIPSYDAYYARPTSIRQTPSFQKQTPYLDALLQDFKHFQARQRNGQRNMFQEEMPKAVPNNIQHPIPIQQALSQSFGQNIPNNIQHPLPIQQALSQSFGQNSSRQMPTVPTTSIMQSGYPPPYEAPPSGLTLQPFLQSSQRPGIYDRQYDPVNQMIAQQMFSQPQPQIVSLSPFQENQREQLRQIPKRFQEIQKKVLQQQRQINEINRRLVQSKSKDEEKQKNLLGQLIQKQQELNQKQRQINNNLDRISKMQSENNLKKQQILQYQLQLQRAKRVEDLARQNERLYHDIIRKQNSNITNTRDMSLSSQPITYPHYSSQPTSPQPTHFRNQYSNRSISAQQAKRFDQIWESDGGNTPSLLSPFAINPDYY